MKAIGQYELAGIVGAGGMGTVYRGIDPRFDRSVAVKLLHTRFARDPDVAQRFRSEAVIQAKLNHPNVVTIYDFVADGDILAIVMEFVEGVPLDRVIEEAGGPLDRDWSVAVMSQVLSAIGYAHEQGLVHRDLKPSNIMIQEFDGEPMAKVMDFGIAKILGSEKMRTATSANMGTLAYMSSEHIRSPKHVDHRSDVYSLGVVLYQMLTGVLPFFAETEYEMMRQIVEEGAAWPVGVPSSGTDHLERVVLAAIAKRPEDRIQDCREFRRRLQSREASRPAPVEPEAVAGRDPGGSEAEGATDWHRASAPAGQTEALGQATSNGGPGARAALLVAVLAILGFLLWRGLAGPGSSPESSSDLEQQGWSDIRDIDFEKMLSDEYLEGWSNIEELCGSSRSTAVHLVDAQFGELDGRPGDEAVVQGFGCLDGTGGPSIFEVYSLDPGGRLTKLGLDGAWAAKDKRLFANLRGKMTFRVERGGVIEVVPVYRDDDANCCPSGGERWFVHRWNGRVLEFEEVVDVRPGGRQTVLARRGDRQTFEGSEGLRTRVPVPLANEEPDRPIPGPAPKCGPGDPGGSSTLRLLDGRINGSPVSASDRRVRVAPGDPVRGSVEVEINSGWRAGAVMAMGVTPTWGRHASTYSSLPSFRGPVSGLRRSVTVDYVAPGTPGSHHIIVAYRAEFNAAQVLSATNWGQGDPQWENGDDVAGWSGETVREANRQGTVCARALPNAFFFPATAIEVWVEGN